MYNISNNNIIITCNCTLRTAHGPKHVGVNSKKKINIHFYWYQMPLAFAHIYI